MKRFLVDRDVREALDQGVDLDVFEIEFAAAGEYPWPDGEEYRFYGIQGLTHHRIFGPYKVTFYDEKEGMIVTTERPKLSEECFLEFTSGANIGKHILIMNAEVYDKSEIFKPLSRDGFMTTRFFENPVTVGDEFEIVQYSFEWKGHVPFRGLVENLPCLLKVRSPGVLRLFRNIDKLGKITKVDE